MGWNSENKNKHNKEQSKININDILKKSVVLTEGFEELHSVPQYNLSDKKLKQQRKVCSFKISMFII